MIFSKFGPMMVPASQSSVRLARGKQSTGQHRRGAMARNAIARSARSRGPGLFGDFANLFHGLLRDLADPYRPELHYMRGPGPAWRAKHGMDAPFRLKPRDL